MGKNKIEFISRIKEIYSNGENIIEFLKNQSRRNFNTIEDILISYDFQAGSYIKFTNENIPFNVAYTGAIAKLFNSLGKFDSLLEVGAGEATTLANVLTKVEFPCDKSLGLDISWSRIKLGVEYLREKKVKADLLVADMFDLPFLDNAIDVIYTSHSIEPNGGKEKEALTELYRVAKKYVVLLEPTNEFASDDGRLRMKKNGYVQDLKDHIQELGYNLITYRPFDVSVNPLNPTGLYVIQKDQVGEENAPDFCCPISKSMLDEYHDHFFCPQSLLSYPKIMGIPCLYSSYGILTSKH